MRNCKFELNGKPMSTFWCGATRFPAFSGLGEHINRRASACILSKGSIPQGTYYIFDRQSGGLLGPFKDLFTGRDEWFALYAIDKKIDDETYCKQVKRGLFRLHPKGRFGISEGCIVLDNVKDFQFLRTILKNTKTKTIPEVGLEAYGKVVVR